MLRWLQVGCWTFWLDVTEIRLYRHINNKKSRAA